MEHYTVPPGDGFHLAELGVSPRNVRHQAPRETGQARTQRHPVYDI
ncbi:MAG TPA: hypothetical protein VFF32_13505 [Dermatophilaceae bacterium]|nr:hypothetical protein [Dermatophilaceae bacterium]